jgi:hypothetical protein
MTGAELVAARKITLLVGGVRVLPTEATAERLREAVEAHNHASRLEGHPDELNPVTLDPERVIAFVEGLPRLPEAVLARLGGRTLALGTAGYALSSSSPVSAQAVEHGYSLSLPDEDEAVVKATLHADVSREACEALAARAEQSARASDAEVESLGARGAPPGEVTAARWRRFAAAKVWETAARSVCEVAPKDREAKKRWKAASQAVKGWVTPPWAGMRRPG